jgi:hypothetical protein
MYQGKLPDGPETLEGTVKKIAKLPLAGCVGFDPNKFRLAYYFLACTFGFFLIGLGFKGND